MSKECNRCCGTGKCQKCDGDGTVWAGLLGDLRIARETCPKCLGSGKCEKCSGAGETNQEKEGN